MTFGKKPAQRVPTVRQMCGAANAAEWNTVREWTGAKAPATFALRALVNELAAR